MASLPFATPDALAAWTGQSIDSADPRALAVLSAASVLIQSEVGADVVTAWTSVPDDVALVSVQIAARVWFNPQGLVADSIDDYSRRWETASESGVYLTQAERDLLSRYRTTGPKGLWTLGVTRGDEYVDQYLDVVNAPTPSTLEEPIPFLPPGA